MNPQFLDTSMVLRIHARSLEAFGGPSGVLDPGALESAVVAPINHFLYTGGDLYDLAGALLWHLVRNHPFADGNKRTALASALVFLSLHGIDLPRNDDFLVNLTLDAAKGALDRKAVAVALRQAGTSE